MAEVKIFNPDTLGAPAGPYGHVAIATRASKLIFIAGQVPTGRDGKIVGVGDFDRQCGQVYGNLHLALRAAGADWKNVCQFMTFLIRPEDTPPFYAYREREYPKLFPGGAYPPNTLAIISRLAHPDFLVEVQAIAAV